MDSKLAAGSLGMGPLSGRWLLWLAATSAVLRSKGLLQG